MGKCHQIFGAHHAETSCGISLQLSGIAAPPFPCLTQVTLSQWHLQGGSPWPLMASHDTYRDAYCFILKDFLHCSVRWFGTFCSLTWFGTFTHFRIFPQWRVVSTPVFVAHLLHPRVICSNNFGRYMLVHSIFFRTFAILSICVQLCSPTLATLDHVVCW